MSTEPIEWTDELLTGNRVVDTQHRLLFTLCNRMESDAENTQIQAILRELTFYTETHFRDEERLMEKHGFADLDHHRELHRKLTAEVIAMRELVEHDKVHSWIKIRDFLKRWLRDHILGEDMAFIRSLKS